MKETAVVILNFNGRKLLETYLPSVVKHSHQAEVIIIDNASTDESILYLNEFYPTLQIVSLDKNLGYAGGYNHGLKFLNNKNFLLLNSDVEVTENWLGPILEFHQSHENVGCIQPKILDWNDKSKFEYAGAAGGFMDKDLFAFCRGRMLSELEVDSGQYDEPLEVFWASGASLFISSAVFNDIGGFDEDFFAHMEEIDLCWRLQNKGYTNYCVPQSSVYHLGGGTLSQQNSHKTYLNFRNNLFIITKNFGGVLFFKIFYRMLLDGIAAWRFLFRGEVANFIAVAKAHFMYYWHLPALLKKRKKCLPKEKMEIKGFVNKSLIYSFFILKIKKYSDFIKQ
ncbi:MAG TPA: dTDP-Rha--alpha-D-GlcNAc-pyrophosphate polyprenol alpha-3-L-rhamnosyltransferase [Flavobacteriales bacterium]|nr:dTDP-Rha--alpha-D-GlcNAc-pyrophosphate polyprenol alpha-3-L-rhamnosyltransferase [Flavobacteriales bacterium]